MIPLCGHHVCENRAETPRGGRSAVGLRMRKKRPPVRGGSDTAHSVSLRLPLQGLLLCCLLTVGYACVDVSLSTGWLEGSSVRTGSISVASDLCRAALVINVTFDFCNVGAAFGGSFANQSCLWGSAAAKAYPNSNVVAIFDEDVVTWHASAAAAHHHRGGGSLGYS